jgi:hypothetical protein
MKRLQAASITAAIAIVLVIIVAIYRNTVSDISNAALPPETVGAVLSADVRLPDPAPRATVPDAPPQREQPLASDEKPDVDDAAREKKLARLEETVEDHPPEQVVAKQDLSYLGYYAYAEIPPDKKPADTVLDTMKGIPVGTPVEEIKRASEAFGLDFVFMRAVAKIESDFDPKQRTGSYIGLFQLSHREFAKYGSGSITDPRDNSVAAAYKFIIESRLFELDTHNKPTLSDIYLIHQQGVQGAAQHVSNPERAAWESMCATDEGREKGEKWCKRAIWANTLPGIKHIWKTVNKLTSGAFVAMWQQRVDHFYARYSEAATPKQ